MIKQCAECGADFSTIPCRIRVGKGIYCSRLCATSSKRTLAAHYCVTCEREYFPTTKDIRGGSKNCSLECSRIFRTKQKNDLALITKRFWAKVDKRGDCWLWTASKRRLGYGQFRMRFRLYLAHQASYILTYGVIPDGLMVCHRCDNPPCVNPDHLFLGTQSDNMQDMVAKKRGWTQQPGNVKQGLESSVAKFTADQVLAIRAAAANKTMTQVEMMKVYNAGEATIYRVIHKKTYRDV